MPTPRANIWNTFLTETAEETAEETSEGHQHREVF